MKDPKKVKRGKKSKAQGATFEKKTREDLIEKGWIVDKFGLNVEFERNIKNFSICPGKSEHTTLKVDGKETNHHIETAYTIEGKLIPAKNKFRGKNIPMMLGSGFPDFVAFRKRDVRENHKIFNSGFGLMLCQETIIGVESKMSGTLSKIEKEKCRWLLDNGIFSKILISRKTKVKNRVVVEYEDFVEIEKRMK